MDANSSQDLPKHYSPGNLMTVVKQAITAMGKTPQTVTLDDLAPMDEFHVGGRESTQALLDPLRLSSQHRILDVGCGVGGAARFVARQYGSSVTGVDLTPEFIDVGCELCNWLGVQDKVELSQGNVLDLPVADNSFDGAYMIHVGMNIEDKAALFKEVARALKPKSPFAIFDLMRIGDGEISFPVPWSGTSATSFVAAQEDYQQALEDAGLKISFTRNRYDYALDFYQRMKTKIETEGPQPMGLHLLMGESTEQRLANAYGAVIAGVIAPVEVVAYSSVE